MPLTCGTPWREDIYNTVKSERHLTQIVSARNSQVSEDPFVTPWPTGLGEGQPMGLWVA